MALGELVVNSGPVVDVDNDITLLQQYRAFFYRSRWEDDNLWLRSFTVYEKVFSAFSYMAYYHSSLSVYVLRDNTP